MLMMISASQLYTFSLPTVRLPPSFIRVVNAIRPRRPTRMCESDAMSAGATPVQECGEAHSAAFTHRIARLAEVQPPALLCGNRGGGGVC